jgi:hypothetical protein
VHGLGGRLVKVNIDAATLVDEEGSQVVYAVSVVGVFMRYHHTVKPIDFGIEKLRTQVRRAIDQDTRPLPLAICALDQKRTTTAPVFRIIWITGAPAECDPRHTHRRAAAQDRKG